MPAPIDHEHPEVHIGKRSAAGAYCWDCSTTLCMDGPGAVHSGEQDRWYAACPICGKTRERGSLTTGAAAVELGFRPPNGERPSGVGTCSSFTWAQEPLAVRTACELHPDEEIVEDEYGRLSTGRQFLTMLETNCPIESTDLIGRQFS